MNYARLVRLCLYILISLPATALALVHVSEIDPAEIRWERAGDAWRPVFSGCVSTAPAGAPDLPGRLIRVALPVGETMAGHDYMSAAALPLVAPGPLATAQTVFDEAGLAKSAPHGGGGEARLEYLGLLAGPAGEEAIFLWRPFASAGEELGVSCRVELHIETAPSRRENPLRRERSAAGGAFAPLERPDAGGSPVDAVIVTTDAMAAAYAQLADWHLSRGTRCVVRSVEWIAANYPPGRDRAENIRFFLQDAYRLWGLKVVILGADTDAVPPRYGLLRLSEAEGELVPTDLYYACLDGDWNGDGDQYWAEAAYGGEPGDSADLLPELWVGRLPSRTAQQAQSLVAKLIAYRETERLDFQNKIAFLAEMLLPANWELGAPYWKDGAEYALRFIYGLLPAEIEYSALFENWIDSIYAPINPDPLSVAAAFALMNAGEHAFVDQNGHGFRYNMSVGDGSVTIGHAQSLTNEIPFHIAMMNCQSAAYDFDSLGEAFLLNPNGGAVGVYGTSRTSFPSLNFAFQEVYYDGLFNAGREQPGAAIAEVRNVMAPASLVESFSRWTYFILNFLGDPLLDLWSGVPVVMEIDAPMTAQVGEQDLVFTVAAGGSPIEGARITLRKAGEVWTTGVSDAAGVCTLAVRPLSEGDLQMTAWAPNARMESLAIPVGAASAAFVHLESCTGDDSPAHSPLNDGDGELDGGEEYHLLLSIRNAGESPAEGVTVDVVSLSDSLTVLSGQESLGTIAGGASAMGSGSVAIVAALGAEDGSLLRVLVNVDGDNLTQRGDTLTFELRAPRLRIAEIDLSDPPPDGDGDGIFEESEGLRAAPRLVNLGGGQTGPISGTLSSLDPDLSIDEGTVAYGSLGRLETAGPAAGFLLTPTIPGLPYQAVLTLTDAFGRVAVDTLELQWPGPPLSLSSDSSLGPDRIDLFWGPSPSADLRGYNVFFAEGEPSGFTRANLLPIDGRSMLVTGLSNNSLIYFYVTAVNESGMTSAPSAIHGTSTNPAQLSGFPLETLNPSSTSVAIGNIAGDSRLELVTAADYVYAWNDDGSEVRDGDEQSQTHGIFNTDAKDIVGSITLIPLLDDGYRQIVVATRGIDPSGLVGIYAIGSDGGVLPGWPRETEDWVWTNLLGADFDGNGDLEIAGTDVDGNVYVFNHDGSDFIPGSGGIVFSGLGRFALASPAAADVDGDGAAELFFYGNNGRLYGIDVGGGDLPGFPVVLDANAGGSAWRSKKPLLIANLDGDIGGSLEIILESEVDSLYVFRTDGSRFPGFPIHVVNDNTNVAAGMALCDVEPDGDLEMLILETWGYSESRLSLMDHDGTVRPGWPVDLAISSQASLLAGDVDGDGEFEFIVGSEQGILYGFGEDGSAQPGFPIGLGGEMRGTPALADLDQDGDVDLVASTWNRRVMVWDFAGPFNAQSCPWPTMSGDYYRSGFAGFWDNVPVLLAGIELAWTEGGVLIAWPAAGGGAWAVDRERRLGAGAWGERERIVAELLPEGERYGWRDGSAGSGETYRYYALQLGEAHLLGELATPAAAYANRLVGAHPNPFNPSTTIVVEAAGDGAARLEIFSPTGKRVRTLLAGRLAAGRHEIVWDGRDNEGRGLASGVYLARFELQGSRHTRRLVLLK